MHAYCHAIYDFLSDKGNNAPYRRNALRLPYISPILKAKPNPQISSCTAVACYGSTVLQSRGKWKS